MIVGQPKKLTRMSASRALRPIALVLAALALALTSRFSLEVCRPG